MNSARRIAALAVVVLTALGGAIALWRAGAGPRVDAYAVERADLLQTVVASGRVESPRRVEIGSVLTATVVSVPVAEGQAVAAGQLLVALDAAEVRAAVDQARSGLEQAEARLAQLRATGLPLAGEAARQAEVTLASAERALARSRELFARGFVGQAALDDAERARDMAQSQWRAARMQRESQSAGGSDERLALAALEQARATLKLAQARLALATIEAPVAGVLIARNIERGAVVQPGKVLMVLSPAGETQLVVQVDEKNLQLLRVGQQAVASSDAYPEMRFAARVDYINPAVDPLRGSVEVKLAVRDPPAYLLQDMTVSVDIEIERRARVLALPADAVRDGAWVLVARDGHAVRQAVKLGVRGEGRVEIAHGLAEGDLVIPAAKTPLAEGAAVRASAAARPAAGRS